jgi:hypothetical protein
MKPRKSKTPTCDDCGQPLPLADTLFDDDDYATILRALDRGNEQRGENGFSTDEATAVCNWAHLARAYAQLLDGVLAEQVVLYVEEGEVVFDARRERTA